MNQRGHSLIELLITLALSIIILAALIPLNQLSLSAVSQQQSLISAVNRLQQANHLMQTDLTTAGATGCLLNKSMIDDRVSSNANTLNNASNFNWLYAYADTSWRPNAPFINHRNIDGSDAIHTLFADLSKPQSESDLSEHEQGFFYLTNCLSSIIARAKDVTPINAQQTQIYPLQLITYYLNGAAGAYTLYRQSLTRTGRTYNEPLVNNVRRLNIAYAESNFNNQLHFKKAQEVFDWQQIKAVYIEISVQVNQSSFSTGRIILLEHNHENE